MGTQTALSVADAEKIESVHIVLTFGLTENWSVNVLVPAGTGTTHEPDSDS